MNYIDEIRKLDFTLKSLLTGTLLLMPFWYLDIHLYAKWFVEAHEFYIPIIISFCLSIGWLMGIIFLYAISKNKHVFQLKDEDSFRRIVVMSVAVLGVFSFIAYFIKDLCVEELYFKKFVFFSFMAIVLLLLTIFFSKDSSAKRKRKQEEQLDLERTPIDDTVF